MNPLISDPRSAVTVVDGLAPWRAAAATERIFRRLVLGRFAGFIGGVLVIEDADGVHRVGTGDHEIRIAIRDPATWGEVATAGTVGAGTAYIRGWWSCDDVVGLVRLLVRNRAVLDGLETGLARLSAPFLRWAHAWNANTHTGSKRNIAAHYDLGNAFFSLWLDPTLLYSSAVFADPSQSLSDAQIAKCDALCRQLDLHFDDHLLEIGTGWGGFAMHAARTYGCRVTTTTISQEQYDLARERVHAAGLDGRVQVLLQDYRELQGSYDKIVSIEMIEAVGHRFYDTYFATVDRMLKPNGLFAIQAITITEQQYPKALQAVDFIQRYIFPGSCIPSVGAITASIGRSSSLNMVAFDDITPHYALTLARWRSAFHEQREQILHLGYDEAFMRMWDFYLAYCEGGFAERAIGCAQICFARPGWRSAFQRRLDR